MNAYSNNSAVTGLKLQSRSSRSSILSTKPESSVSWQNKERLIKMSLYFIVSKWTLFMQIEAKSLHEQKSCTSSSKKLNLPFFYFCSSYCERQILQLISGLYESVFGIEAVGMCKILKNLLSVVFSMGFPSLLNS